MSAADIIIQTSLYLCEQIVTALPIPAPHAQAHSEALIARIQTEIEAAGGWLDFSRYMELALYAPALGYYSAGAAKFGEAGDFVTAPEISPLFAQTLAAAAGYIVQATDGDLLELGAGSGALATGLLLELDQRGALPAHYYILEVSADLRNVQRQRLQQSLPSDLFERVVWLDALPYSFSGMVLGNEVLDALPVHLLKTEASRLYELGVAQSAAGFVWEQQLLAAGTLYERVRALDLPDGYTIELCPAAIGLIASLAGMLRQGLLLFIDYGFPRQEYYHAQRNQGTLMCHYRHHVHSDPLRYVGLQDITAHVDFTTIAEAGIAQGLELAGYCGQAQFLINCGITDVLGRISPDNAAAYFPLVAQAQKLLSPAEMGELFKVIGLSRGLTEPLPFFLQGDRRHTL